MIYQNAIELIRVIYVFAIWKCIVILQNTSGLTFAQVMIPPSYCKASKIVIASSL